MSDGISIPVDLENDTLVEYEDQSKKEYDEDDWDISMYLKVGLFCGWSWQDFENTPHKVKMLINEEIDRRLEEPDEDSTVLNWQYLATILALGRAFGGNKS